MLRVPSAPLGSRERMEPAQPRREGGGIQGSVGSPRSVFLPAAGSVVLIEHPVLEPQSEVSHRHLGGRGLQVIPGMKVGMGWDESCGREWACFGVVV